ncbi:NAD-dependent epimerase/dehydratase family protein [Paenibacillus allorhizosphaerae]|uniref:NAD-dependent epimerase/dehydratase domain-containing protein n=1 Tax=Paenibacillus allorhizosphaerae TaxID=2849866 RepID=A0ABM8VI57_9BACL|nr:NAD-dependent epimerase/dehydratase family protein [Paenibacillus allorhizosphaerae]CAG7643642.1 hypothetical protein PAECIP111802_03063 [Paenibacillus allorhizosphaerae]
MKKVLVMGGTRFFGKRLVQHLLDEGVDVTIATRGRTPDPHDGQVNRLVLDREDAVSLQAAADAGPWDIVYDQICYSPQNAADACEAFKGKTGRYIVVSTRGVYDHGPQPIAEDAFNPFTYPVKLGARSEFSYEEGKRQSEAVFFQRADFPVCAVRIPIVLGKDDYTRRLHFHIEHVRGGLPIGVPQPEARMSFIHSGEAASFLAWLGNVPQLTGPVNACSDGDVMMREVIAWTEEAVGRKAVITTGSEAEHMSPFAIPDSYCLDTSKARAAGYRFESIRDWMPALIRELASAGS